MWSMLLGQPLGPLKQVGQFFFLVGKPRAESLTFLKAATIFPLFPITKQLLKLDFQAHGS